MSQRRISAPSIKLNNNVIAIVPNTFMYTEGRGEDNVSVASAGGNATELITSTNIEEYKSKASFEVYSTKKNIDFLRAVKTNTGKNVLEFFDTEDGFSRTITFATIVNNYEINLGAEGTISIEIEGNQAI